MSGRWFVGGLSLIAASTLLFALAVHVNGADNVRQSKALPRPTRQALISSYGQLPLAFEANEGQTDPGVKYLARGSGYMLFLTSHEAVFAVQPIQKQGQAKKYDDPRPSTIRMEMLGTRRDPKVSAADLLPGKSNYFIGHNPTRWHENVSQYGRVTYTRIYPGIDLAFHGEQHRLEFDFLLAAHADPRAIKLQLHGVDKLRTDSSGSLVLGSSAGDMILHSPVAYQDFEGARHVVATKFVVSRDNRIGFDLGAYDHSRELVIDPTVSYSTYLGGTGQDNAYGIAVDASGNTYVTGLTSSTDFPVTMGTAPTGPTSAFVTKFAAGGAGLVYSSYFGGSGTNPYSGNAIAVDSSGNAYVAGGAGSDSFPISSGAFQTTCPNSTVSAGFVLKLTAAGTLSYSTLLGCDDTTVTGIAFDNSGNAYVAGATDSTSFPTKNPIYGSLGTSTGSNAFVTEVNPTGTALVYSTYLGGNVTDNATAIALDSSGDAYITGVTDSPTFPVTSGAFQSSCGGGCADDDAFVTEIDASGSSVVYSSFLGGSGMDNANSIAVDISAAAYVTGLTTSSDFPTQSPFQSALASTSTQPRNAFITKVSGGGSALAYSTYMGGNTQDAGYAIAVDPLGNAYATGQTSSSNFPMASPANPLSCCASLSGNSDAFIVQLNASGAGLGFSSYFGGIGDEDFQIAGTTQNVEGRAGIALDSANNLYVAGNTDSTGGTFISASALQPVFAGGLSDAFVTEISAVTPLSPGIAMGVTPLSPSTVSAGATATSTITIAPLAGYNAQGVTLSCSTITPSTNAPSCSFSNLGTAVAGPYLTSKLTVTAAGGSARLHDHSLGHFVPFYATLFPVTGVVFIGFGARRKSRRFWQALLVCLAGAALIFVSSCGSSSSSGGTGPTSTQYTITVSAAGNGISTQTATLTLTVQ